MGRPENWENQAKRVEESFARQGMMATLGAVITDLEPGRCVISLPLGSHLSQQQGAAHAAATFAIGDSAAGYAALTLMADGVEVMTVEMKINLLSPATGVRLLAEGRVIKAGRRISVVGAEVLAEDATGRRTPVALLQGTMIPVAIPVTP